MRLAALLRMAAASTHLCPGKPVGRFAVGDQARDLPRGQIDFSHLVAVGAGDVGGVAVGANQSLLRIGTDSDRWRRLHGLEVDDVYLVFVGGCDEQPASVGRGGASVTEAIERHPA